jgi:hypothetical protein
MQHALRTPHTPNYIQSVREILEAEERFLEETLNQIDREDTRRGGRWTGYDMGDLIAHATYIDRKNREINKRIRKQQARHRLCRIIAMQYTRAVIEGDIDECDRLADALVLATRDWCNGG